MNIKFTALFEELGLSPNEAKIYEKLLSAPELSLSEIATITKIHRRNVYDSVTKLLERGLVFEIVLSLENRYQAVDPQKLSELIQEKRQVLLEALPGLTNLYNQTAPEQDVFIYRGIEGWKSYMQDILRVGKDFYCFGGKGAWMDRRLSRFFPIFIEELKQTNISCYHLFDHEVKTAKHPIVDYVGKNYKFLPPTCSVPCSFDVFGSHVNIVSNIQLGGMDDEDFAFSVVVNHSLGEAFRTWFRFVWDHYSET